MQIIHTIQSKAMEGSCTWRIYESSITFLWHKKIIEKSCLKISHMDECSCGTGPQIPDPILQHCLDRSALQCQTLPQRVEPTEKLRVCAKTREDSALYPDKWASDLDCMTNRFEHKRRRLKSVRLLVFHCLKQMYLSMKIIWHNARFFNFFFFR